MSLLELPFSYKDIKLPQNRKDKTFFLLMLCGIPFAVIWEAFVILPNYYDRICFMVVVHAVAALFIVYNIFGNMLQLKKTDSTSKRCSLPNVLQPGWRYCYPCGLNSPPRSYHCTVCNECVLKRDHHCVFAGCCVGYHNHRYYLLAVVYTLIGSVYGVCYEWDYVISTAGGYNWWTFPCFIAPHFCWLFGLINWYSVVVIFLHDAGMTVMFSMTYLFVNQIVSVSKGQTLYEKRHNVNDYNISFVKNWIEVLGYRWHLTWISPFVISALPGNGLKFTRFEEYEDVKTI